MRTPWLSLFGVAFALNACQMSLAPDVHPGGNPAPYIVDIMVSPAFSVRIVGESVRLGAVAYTETCDIDFCKYSQTPAAFAWRSSNTRVVTVSSGLVQAVGPGTAYVIAEANGIADSGVVRVGTAYVALARVGVGGRCALTDGGVAYCWAGLSPFWLSNFPEIVPGTVSFTAIATGSALTCAIAADAQGYCWRTGDAPALIAGGGGLHFQSLSPGRREASNPDNQHNCGVLLDSTAVCWGADDAGQLGTASPLSDCYNAEIGRNYRCSATPVPVTGLTGLVAVSAGSRHTCALAADGTASCWGDNSWGQLGDSAMTRETPRAVRGVPPLAAIVAGTDHTCGITRTSQVFCWGRNQAGQLGIGSQDSLQHPVPALVDQSLLVTSLDAASQATCALTLTGSVYCWGNAFTAPTPVPGAVAYQSIGVLAPTFPGFGVSPVACGIATSGRGYCWEVAGNPFALQGPVLP